MTRPVYDAIVDRMAVECSTLYTIARTTDNASVQREALRLAADVAEMITKYSGPCH